MNRSPKDDRSNLSTIARRAMIERGMEPDFSPAVQREVASLRGPAEASAGVRDLRQLLWASIDNDDSRDLDQLTVAESLGRGQIRVLVAIADVDALVPQDDAIDDHARRNTTSVYTTAAIFPMLPEVLSTGLTSLNQGRGPGRRRGRHAVRCRRRARGFRNLPGSGFESSEARVSQRRGLARRRRTGSQAARRRARPRSESPSSGRLGAKARRAAAPPRCVELRERRSEAGLRRGRPCGSRARPQESRQADHRGLHDRGQRRDRGLPRGEGVPVASPRPAVARALGSSRRARPSLRRAAPRPAERCGARGLPREATRGQAGNVRRLVAGRRQVDRSREYAVDLPGGDLQVISASPSGIMRTPRRRTGDFPTSSRNASSKLRCRAARRRIRFHD